MKDMSMNILVKAVTQEQAKELKAKGEPICFKHKGETICAEIKRVNTNTISFQTMTMSGRVPLSWAVPKSEWKEDYVSKRQKKVESQSPIQRAMGDANYERSNVLDIDSIPDSKLPAFHATVKSMGFCADRMRETRNKCNDLNAALCKTTFNQDRQCVQDQAQKLLNQLNDHYGTPRNKIQVDGTRKSSYRGGDEYGHYVVNSTNIVVYPYTAKREDVVANKTMLETIVHEWNHHYDQKKLNLKSVHTSGFYKRTSKIHGQLKTILD